MKFLSYDGLLYFCQKIKALLAGKVDKVDGKGLSTNDYTTAEKTKLAGLMNYIHPTTSGNKHIPAGGSANQILGWSADGTAKWVNEKDTTYSVMSGATVDADGKSGLVPSPTKGAQRWLDSTGAWTTPSNTTYGAASTTSAGLMSAADKKKLDGIAEGANKYSLPTATSSVLGGVKTGANITNNSGVLSVTAANVRDALGYTPPKQDTNTWRPVVNNLTSSATDQSLAANQGKILNESKAAMIVLTNENLNDVVTPGFYSSGGGNNVTNKPSNVDNFGLIVIHQASGNYYTQIIYGDSAAYRRHCTNGTWSGWVQDKLTDTDTWRGIQNNLTSDSTTDSLSAAQGKALKTLVDGKAATGHTHNSIKDIGNKSSDTTFAYSKAGMSYTDYTWLAGWNGYELRAVNKDQFATAGHTHDASVLINNLSIGDSTPQDDDYYVSQYAGGGTTSTTYYRRPVKALWSYIKGKGDAIYQPKGSYAASNHTHDDRYYTESEIDAKLKTKADTHSHPYLPLAGGTVTGVTAFTNTTASTNKSTGAVKVSGGVGVAGRMSANEVMIGDGCTLRYDATNKCVNFTFS